MNAVWSPLAVRFGACSMREKLVLSLAALAVFYLVIDSVWLAPSIRVYEAEKAALTQKQIELGQLSAQVTQLAAQMKAQEESTRVALDRAKLDMGEITGRLSEFEKTLVPANRMTQFLEGILPGRALEVVSVKTLPVTPLIARVKPADGANSNPLPRSNVAAGDDRSVALGDGGEGEDAPAANLYKHGVEITLAGSYAALLDYLDRIEQSQQKVLWGRLELRVKKYPRSELTLVLYTLSLDPSWLVV